uniref:NADH-ubiquinone oxidoreductase chain 6 n=2 Tax=Elseya TaxID=44496 RepID=A0A0A6ZDZ8_9SAUR|nr:NADH dehydrogenase subunit 6 [Elseya branderhorsti]YP_009571101.1 NADH dehydrogenase subunit 6 [Elseya dentata]AGL45217.1 NADH dehydrogenase subunit 6 [Elseya branderhorsti]AUW55041.1 NADH dehydrogenase subunit 6 [Elseya branderhorsti]AUW55054.1 NADH dehydrogenase subunit 6 [Elseya branderhorsti]AUY54806.1 NADH dehydrogenase subunit 6 [Elseya branderhorsti]AUY54819.1 NADH dehydrogenase subunit 6 [Elseya branderhorsti]
MVYFSFLFGFGLVFWMIGVASNISPYYGILSLLMGAVFGCGVLVWKGGSFMSLVLFLIYLGGMLVIFAYSATLVLEPFPTAFSNWEGVINVFNYVLLVVVLVFIGSDWWCGMVDLGDKVSDADSMSVVRVDFVGVSLFYYLGCVVFLVAGVGLLLTLFVVLVLIRGLYRGAVRVI